MLYCQHSGGEKTRSRLGVFFCRWITITHVHTEKSDFSLPHVLCLLRPQLAVGGMSPIFSFSVTRHLRQVVDVVSTKRGGGKNPIFLCARGCGACMVVDDFIHAISASTCSTITGGCAACTSTSTPANALPSPQTDIGSSETGCAAPGVCAPSTHRRGSA